MKYRAFIVVLALIALVADFLFILTLKRQSDSRNFSRVTGLVTESRVRSYNETEGGGISLSYKYEVNHHVFDSHTYRFIVNTLVESKEDIVEKYPKGTEVAVFYNPQKPGEAVLSPGLGEMDCGMIKIFTILNLVAAFVIWFTWWKYMRKRVIL